MPVELPTLSTHRLILRPLEMSDADMIQGIFSQWEIVRFMASFVPWPYPADGAITFLRDRALPAMHEGKEWHWSIRTKAAPEQLIGVISLKAEHDNNRGFWVDPAWQGQGIATEACEAVTDYWFEVLGQPVLRVAKAIENTPSRRISESSGMRVIETDQKDYVSGRLPAELWEITREEWRAKRPS